MEGEVERFISLDSEVEKEKRRMFCLSCSKPG